MKLLAASLLAVAAFGQAVQLPSNSNFVTSGWLSLDAVHYSGTWSSSTTYASRDLVIYAGASYISLQAANLNHAPNLLSPWWVALPGRGGVGGSRGSITGTLFAQAAGEVANPYTNMHEGASTYANPEPCITVVSKIRIDFQQAASSAQVRLFTAPAYWSPRSFRVEETTQVTSGSRTVSAIAACIGTTGSPCGYASAFPLMFASSPTFREVSGGATLASTADGTQDVYLQLAVTNTSSGNLSNLTGGSVTTRICGVVLQ